MNIDRVPSHWSIARLGQVCDFLDSQRVPLNEAERDARIAGRSLKDLYPYFGANGQVGWIDNYLFDEPLILLAEDGGPFGSHVDSIAYAVQGKSWVNNHAHVLRPRHEVIDYQYCLYSLMIRPDIESLISGTTRGKLNLEAAKLILIPLPPLAEQRRIAAILRAADDERRRRRYTQSLSDGLLREVFVRMFGDPATNPLGWATAKLPELGTLDRGRSKHRPRNAPELYGGNYPFIQTGDVANAPRYIWSYSQAYSELGLAQSKMWAAGTLCITIAANIAKTAITTFGSCFPDSVVGFTPVQPYDAEYVLQWFSFVQANLEEIAPESAQKNINLEILRGLDVPIPPDRLRAEFATTVAAHEQTRRQQQESARQSDHLFATLLHRAFAGEL